MLPLYKSPEVIVTTPNGEVILALQHIPEKQFIYANWTWCYEAGVEMVYKGCEAMLQLVKEKKAKAVLADTRFCRNSWDEANEWIANNWTPRMITEGLSFLGVIVSEDIFSLLSAEELQDKVAGLTMRNHSSPEGAIVWLEESLKQKSPEA